MKIIKNYEDYPLSLLNYIEKCYAEKLIPSLTKVERLVSAIPDINIQNKQGDTALMLATVCGYSELADYLIDNFADVNIKNNEGNTALILASRYGKLDVIESLIMSGANETVMNKQGWTAFDLVKNDESLQILQQSVAKFEEMKKEYIFKKKKENSILQYLIESKGNPDVKKVRKLIDNGADLDFIEQPENVFVNMSMESSPLLYACQCGFADVVKELLRAGADPNIEDKLGCSPMFYLAEYAMADPNKKNRPQIAKMLIFASAKPKQNIEKGGMTLC